MLCSPSGLGYPRVISKSPFNVEWPGWLGYQKQIKSDFSIALVKEAPLAEKMIYWTREVCRDQRRRTSLRPTPRAGSRLGPMQSLAPAGTLSALWLLFNWPRRETKRGGKGRSGRGGLKDPAGHRRALAGAHYSARRWEGSPEHH